jgi:alkylation response protein AidB-like acyl-CoA dehydrogenase
MELGGPTTTQTLESVADFSARSEAFLSARYRRSSKAATRPFIWGEGSDQLRVFQEPDPVTEPGLLDSVKSWRRDLWDAGLAWITGPLDLGGAGLTPAHARAFDRVVRGYDVPGNAMLTVSIGMIAPTVMAHGSADQQRRYVPALQRADLVACQLFSEPCAGSDLAAVRTSARRDGDGWRLAGQKVWTSGAHLSDVGLAICATAIEPRHQNLTAFLVDMHSPRITVRPLRQMTGGAAFNEVFLDDVFVPEDDRVGEVGGGWRVALTTLGHERGAMGGESFGGVGLLRTDRLVALLNAAGRRDDPVARQQLADLIVHLRVALYAQQRSVARIREGGTPGPELSMGKLALSRNLMRLSEFAAALLGPKLVADTGEWGTYAWTSVVLGAPGYRLGGGTDEIMKNIVAEKVLGLPR